ncbi:hypothetical protein [Cupriavidus sp. TMH.W2]|uniref:hypothetical protein n=1 Tax=Cupriavidus sp. TMH.W2 TaxID=3434465 RepID=UPI003D782333
MKVLPVNQALQMGYPADKRKRRRHHRLAARALLAGGGFLNAYSARGSTLHGVAMWHLWQARHLGR